MFIFQYQIMFHEFVLNNQNFYLISLLKFLFFFIFFLFFLYLPYHFLHNHIIINNFIARYSSSLGIKSVINKTVATVATQ